MSETQEHRLHVMMPAYDSPEAATLKSLLDLRNEVPFSFDVIGTAEVSVARTLLVDRIPDDATLLLWVDSDMMFSPQHFHRLMQSYVKNPQAGFISGAACKRDGSYQYVMNWHRKRRWSKKPKGDDFFSPEEVAQKAGEYTAIGAVVPVDVTGMAFAIMDRNIFKRLKKPWFRPQWRNNMFYGEDTSFIYNMQKLGYQPSVDFGCHLGHIGKKVYIPRLTEEQLERYKKNVIDASNKNAERAANESPAEGGGLGRDGVVDVVDERGELRADGGLSPDNAGASGQEAPSNSGDVVSE